jgi:hypothetical protein
MDDRDELEQGTGRGKGWAAAGWTAFFLLLALIGFFGYRVWNYYTLIRSGQIIDLPQFAENFTRGDQADSSSRNVVERSVVEDRDSPALGTEQPVLTIVEFADYECPYSRDVSTAVRRIAARYGDRVRIIYRDFPIGVIHPNAYGAAMAAECAGEQGKFWPYHDKLYANAPSLGYADLIRYGDELGLDRRQFEKCLADGRPSSSTASGSRAPSRRTSLNVW